MVDNTKWPMSDFGNITLAELPSKNYEWYLEKATSKKDAAQSILTKLRELYPVIPKIETTNKLNVNLKVAIRLIEMLRHVIVHKSGVADSKDAFIEKTLQKAGISGNGEMGVGSKDFIRKFFGENDYANHVILQEIRLHSEIPLDLHHNLFGELVGYLMAEAFTIYQAILRSQNHVEKNK